VTASGITPAESGGSPPAHSMERGDVSLPPCRCSHASPAAAARFDRVPERVAPATPSSPVRSSRRRRGLASTAWSANGGGGGVVVGRPRRHVASSPPMRTAGGEGGVGSKGEREAGGAAVSDYAGRGQDPARRQGCGRRRRWRWGRTSPGRSIPRGHQEARKEGARAPTNRNGCAKTLRARGIEALSVSSIAWIIERARSCLLGVQHHGSKDWSGGYMASRK